ncbi:MAG: 30S ribosomal protein S17 [Candidatus Aenigmatarchaeota archaeon]
MAFSKMHKAKKGHNNIGLEAAAPQKKCSDPKCPWHGNISLRGRLFTGLVTNARSPKTAIVQWDFVHYLPKYERYERRHSRLAAYNPECVGAKEGDMVRIAECRPLSKTKSFAIIEIVGGRKQ